MLVNQWMTRQLISVGPTDTLASAAERMARNHLRRVLVMEDDRLVGILARSDVLRAGPAGTNPFSVLGVPATGFDKPVHEAMAAAVVTAPPDLPIRRRRPPDERPQDRRAARCRQRAHDGSGDAIGSVSRLHSHAGRKSSRPAAVVRHHRYRGRGVIRRVPGSATSDAGGKRVDV